MKDERKTSRLQSGARAKSLSAFALAALLALACAAARGATLPAGFAETQIAVGLASPTAMAFAPDGRVFVCLQGGQLRVVKNGALLPTPFLTLTVSSVGERGLLGVAFDPNFSANRFVYVYYTATTPTVHNRVSRFTASASNPDVAEAGSEVALLDLETLGPTNHNGGAMHFGADGKLYVAVGDNASGANAQSYANKLGKILRINVDPANLIPADNPFVARTTGTNQSIWALGLRNPYTFAVQPGTGRVIINDVGEVTWEEINAGSAGANYGWPACEGNCPVPAPTPTTRPPDTFTNPVFQYAHSGPQPTGCAITGGTFYNPPAAQFPSTYVGKYFFADFCTSFIRYIDPDSPSPSQPFATGLASPVDLQVAADGSLYYLERGNTGRLMRVSHAAGSPPSITSHPQSRTVAEGGSVTFTVAAAGGGALSYQWQRNNVNIPGANSVSYTLSPAAAADDDAQFRAVVTNEFGGATSNAATLQVFAAAASGEILISEFRIDGPAGSSDEFVELYNRTDRAITVAAFDASPGWAIAAASIDAAPAVYHVIPAGTVIPARSRHLVAGAQYSLSNYGGANASAPDAASANDLAAAGAALRGLGLFRAADPAAFTAANRLDSVGCAANPHPLLVEGAGTGPCHAVGTDAQPAADYSFLRRLNSGAPQDTNDNAADFQLVAAQVPLASPAAGAPLASVLGAPGPENSDAPAQRNQIIKASLLDPCAGVGASPNQERDATFSDPSNNQTRGTFTLRRRFTNNTGASLTILRFRIVDFTTAPAPPCSGDCDGIGDTSDLRALISPARPSFDITGTGCVGTRTVAVEGLTLDSPPAQPRGGGINSTLAAGTITSQTPLAPGDSVNVEFLLGVERPGFYRFFVNVEALPAPPSAPAAHGQVKGGNQTQRKAAKP